MANIDNLIELLGDHPVSRKLGLGDFWDGDDVWGSAIAEGFALCDWLTFELRRPDVIPGGLNYHPSPFGPGVDDPIFDYIHELWPTANLSAARVAEYLELLNILLDECIALGLDY